MSLTKRQEIERSHKRKEETNNLGNKEKEKEDNSQIFNGSSQFF